MHVTLAEFSQLYPQFAGLAGERAAVLDRSARSLDPLGEEAFSERVLFLACQVADMEARCTEGVSRRIPDLVRRWQEYHSSFSVHGEDMPGDSARPVFVSPGSPQYLVRAQRMHEQRQARLESLALGKLPTVADNPCRLFMRSAGQISP